MTFPNTLTLRPRDFIAGTAQKVARVRVFPTPAEYAIVAVYDPDTDTHTLLTIDTNQQWFYSDEWQAMERDADEDMRQGRFEEFETMEDFINSL